MASYDQVTVTVQPGMQQGAQISYENWPANWMQPPDHNRVQANCPPGLEQLAVMPEIFIQQRLSWMEICCGCEANQKYDITHPETGKMLYQAIEDTSCCTRAWCGPARPLEMDLNDHTGKSVLHLTRPFHCASGLGCPPCMDEFIVSLPSGQTLGSVRQQFTWCTPLLHIFDANGDAIFKVKGPCWHCKCCEEVPFKIYSMGETTECGVIAKRWTGAAKELCTDVDNFRIAFPTNLEVRMRAVLVAACFCIDLLFFENQDQ
eukprot:Seg1008.8 transcript_id=Seg1008.8/GoldUCD/mRNA.D3Y31 product="Phospholipid scramblase 2" protein_id=Seg1008.8/GoldUCD/D3Y31